MYSRPWTTSVSLEQQVKSLASRLQGQRQVSLLEGALAAGLHFDNPTALMQFSVAMRELVSDVLEQAAPYECVRRCSWFLQDDNHVGVTRRQRAMYAAHGGLEPAFLAKSGIYLEKDLRDLSTLMKELQAQTHAKTGTLGLPADMVELRIEETLETLVRLLKSLKDVPRQVGEALADTVYGALQDFFFNRTIEEFDLVSSKGYEVDPWIDDPEIVVSGIDAGSVHLTFAGGANVTLHYGKGKDATVIEHPFPFRMFFRADVSTPESLNFVKSEIDDSGWYT